MQYRMLLPQSKESCNCFYKKLTRPVGHSNAPVAQISGLPASGSVGSPVTLTLQEPAGLDLSSARFTWEGRDQAPIYGPSFTFTPKNSGSQWVEVEAQLPDGRRVFAQGSFNAK